MGTNHYFNNFENSSEQNLLDDLTVESIQIHGHDVFYLPRTLLAYDPLYEQAQIVEYRDAYMVEMYIEHPSEGFGGERDIMSKFGLEIRDRVEFTVAIKAFYDNVTILSSDIELNRPREGDIIYFPLNKRAFQILFVEKFQMFYPLGSLHTYKLTTELFEYSSERFRTGIAEIDKLEQTWSQDLLLWAIRDENNDWLLDEANNIIVNEGYKTEPTEDTTQVQSEANTYIDWPETENPLGDVPPGGQ